MYLILPSSKYRIGLKIEDRLHGAAPNEKAKEDHVNRTICKLQTEKQVRETQLEEVSGPGQLAPACHRGRLSKTRNGAIAKAIQEDG
jgi:hypothetical protein